jgi:hypothetical protein
MHIFALLFPLSLATAFGSPAPEAKRKVNNGPYENATPFSPFSPPPIPTRKNDNLRLLGKVTFYTQKKYQNVHSTLTIGPARGIPTDKCTKFRHP